MGNQKKNPGSRSLAADDSGFCEVDSHQKRIDKLSTFRKSTLQIIDEIAEISNVKFKENPSVKYDPFWEDVLKPIKQCGNYLLFRHYFEFKKAEKVYQGDPKLFHLFTCQKHLVCPFCALLRQHRLHRRLYPILKEVLTQNPTLTAYHLTLTVPNQKDLLLAFKNLVAGFRELLKVRRMELKAKRYKKHTEFSKVQGGLYAIEIKRGKKKLWHPHIHALLFCESEPYVINEDEMYKSGWMYHPDLLPGGCLNSEFYKLTGGFQMCLDPIRAKKTGDDLFDALCEVVKYGIKPGELSARDIMTVYETMQGKRLIGTFGGLRGVKLPAAGPDDDHPVDLEFDEYFYQFLEKSGYVRVVEN